MSQPNSEPADLITTAEACERLGGISRSTLFELRKRTDFPVPMRIGRRVLRWSAAEIDAFVERRRVG
jgi:predicted DNA-binding transcriptional regulator AlpA